MSAQPIPHFRCEALRLRSSLKEDWRCKTGITTRQSECQTNAIAHAQFIFSGGDNRGTAYSCPERKCEIEIVWKF